MDQVHLTIMLKDGSIVVPKDIDDPLESARLEILRESAHKLIGHLKCPHNEELCGVNIAIRNNFALKIINLCHGKFADLIKEELKRQPSPKRFFLED